jgi:hypothetical protein
MWPVLIVVGEPVVEIGLQLGAGMVDLLTEGDPVERKRPVSHAYDRAVI